MEKSANRLALETSPYLLQHAHNPVDWYPWGEEALAKAREENKPILVSIGYSACHWCHVMERESFENETTARYMNQHFVNIKIDREERPDLDQIYMDAVQALTGSGGWPLNVFLTPEAKPFYGGTYFPPSRAFNRASWMETLEAIVTLFKERRQEVEEQAEKMTNHIVAGNNLGLNEQSPDELVPADANNIAANILKHADTNWGGFGGAPKFPQTQSIQYLLRYHHFTADEKAREQALLSLDKMIAGGIYDQLGGGFARYATDTEWLVPHFEKMLYDNALIISAICEAYQLEKNEKYLEVITETLAFIKNELTDVSGGFYAALDADSEGVEGKFYVWNYDEVQKLLGPDADLFCQYYDITPGGNWEHQSILRVLTPLETFARQHSIEIKELQRLIEKGKHILLKERANRVRPGLDDKIILGWNALMNVAYSKAYQATGKEEYLIQAKINMQFIWQNFRAADGTFSHTWKKGQAKFPAFLDDYAYLIQALLQLYQVTTELQFLERAHTLCHIVVNNFSDSDHLYFYYTHRQQTDVILRKKEMYDGATPSGNSIMALNLLHLSIFFDNRGFKERSFRMVSGFNNTITAYPTSFSSWAGVLLQWVYQPLEIVILGKNYKTALSELQQAYLPHQLVMAADQGDDAYPMLAGKKADKEKIFYLCQNFSCSNPVYTVGELLYLTSDKKLSS